MDIIFSTGAFPGYRLATIFALARAVAADGLEVMLTGRLLRAGPEAVAEIERRERVPVRSVHAVMRLRDQGPTRLAEDIVASARYARALRRCTALVIHTPATAALEAAAGRAWLDAVETAREALAGTGVRLAVENGGRFRKGDPVGLFDLPDRLRWLAAEWDLGITLDVAHAASCGWEIESALDDLLPRLANVHLSDYRHRWYPHALANSLIRDHRLPGEGDLPLDRWLAQLAASGYAGPVTLELSPLAVRSLWPRAAERRLRGAIRSCREAIAGTRPADRGARHRQIG
ncbi:MAG: sugar phosphate isomerase/epimerase [Thermomicrobiaceae bacterium]|nr:sugar phosphate isomerase/epimerase [Thermomicrobiaceae bacterium]